MKTSKQSRRKGLIVQPDDLQIGNYYAVYASKEDPHEPIQISGMAFRLTAMNLPFIVGRLASDPVHPVTFDSRFLTFVRVSDDYVAAQRQGQETA